MKRLLAPPALLLASALTACTTTTDNTNTRAVNTNTNANAAAAATPAGVTQADIEARERQAWDAMKAKNWEGFAANLADDFVYVTDDGLYDKAQTVESVKKLDLTEYAFSDVKFIRVDADLAVITYTCTEKSTYDGRPGSGKPERNSSAWVNRGGKWLVAYHQDTEVAAPPAGQPTPAAAASPLAAPAATTAAPPAASPAPASATDAEKAVWDAIRGKNAEAFSNFLLPEALEVEPEGVYDRAASSSLVMQFDASRFTLSDFRETKLDADATLLTYVVNGPMAGGNVTERASTIWTNRGGQWKAAFHQGTPQRAPK